MAQRLVSSRSFLTMGMTAARSGNSLLRAPLDYNKITVEGSSITGIKAQGVARISGIQISMYSTRSTKDAAPAQEDPTLPGTKYTLIQKIKGFISFYKGGLKELVRNVRTSNHIKARIDNGEVVSREEFQIVHRTPGDKLRLIPFGFLVVILPESIPLFILMFPGITPSTCMTFGQLNKMAKKQDLVRENLHAWALQRVKAAGIPANQFETIDGLNKLGQLSKESGGEYGAGALMKLEALAPSDVQAMGQFMKVGRRKDSSSLLKHLNYLKTDDSLLLRESGVKNLGLTELHRACQERGIPTAGYPEKKLRADLDSWIRLTTVKSLNIISVVWSRMVLYNKTVKG